LPVQPFDFRSKKNNLKAFCLPFCTAQCQKATGQGELLICSMRLNSLEGFIAKPNFVRGADETKGLVIKRFIPAISNRKSQWVGLLYIYFVPVQLTGLVGNAVCIVVAAGAVAWGAVSEWSRIAVRRAAMAKRS
jgi:hypothetical protein